MGFYRAWLFGEQAIDHMDAMTAPDGYQSRRGCLSMSWARSTMAPSSGGRRVQCPPENGRWIEFGLPTPDHRIPGRAISISRNGPRESVIALKRAARARGWSKCRLLRLQKP